MGAAGRWTATTWNLQGSKSTDLDAVVGVLDSHSPDVVLLQEVRERQATRIADRLGHSVHWAFKHQAWAPLRPGTAEGAAITTPHHLDRTGSLVVSDVTSRRDWRRRIAVWGVVSRRDGTAFRVLNVHLSPHDLRVERTAEADRIAELVAGWPTPPPTVIGGDFNDHGEPETVARLPGVEHVPSPPTNPAIDPVNAIDHVLLPAASSEVVLTVPDGGDRWNGVSDHLPVTVSFTVGTDVG